MFHSNVVLNFQLKFMSVTLGMCNYNVLRSLWFENGNAKTLIFNEVGWLTR